MGGDGERDPANGATVLQSAIGLDMEIDLLKLEYESLRSELRMAYEQHHGKFGIFAVLVLSTAAFALKDPKYHPVFAVIPFLIFLLMSYVLMQFYATTACIGRLRMIERRIADLNNGTPILVWESQICRRLMFPSIVKISFRDKQRGTITIVNPTMVTAFCLILVVVIFTVICLIKILQFLPLAWGLSYTVVILILSIYLGVQLMSLTRLSAYIDSIEYSNTDTERTKGNGQQETGGDK